MPALPRRPDLCIFDLDGTLLDSLQDIAESLNECLSLLALPTYPIESYRFMVGEGLPLLCRRALAGAHPWLYERLIELARARYRTRMCRHTRPYPGIDPMLQRLARSDMRLAVLSNKPHDATSMLVQRFWANGPFYRVQGYVQEQSRKPNPHFVHAMCDELGIHPTKACLIGDTGTDIDTARQAGAMSVGVTWGFRPGNELREAGADAICDQPHELGALLASNE